MNTFCNTAYTTTMTSAKSVKLNHKTRFRLLPALCRLRFSEFTKRYTSNLYPNPLNVTMNLR